MPKSDSSPRYGGKTVAESRKITRRGRTFDRTQLTDGTFGKYYISYEMWLAVLLTARASLEPGTPNEVYDKFEQVIDYARFQADSWLDAMEINLLSEERSNSKEKYIIYKLKEAKVRLAKRTGLYETDTQEFWDNDSATIGVEPDVMDLFKISMRNFDEWANQPRGEQLEMFEEVDKVEGEEQTIAPNSKSIPTTSSHVI